MHLLNQFSWLWANRYPPQCTYLPIYINISQGDKINDYINRNPTQHIFSLARLRLRSLKSPNTQSRKGLWGPFVQIFTSLDGARSKPSNSWFWIHDTIHLYAWFIYLFDPTGLPTTWLWIPCIATSLQR